MNLSSRSLKKEEEKEERRRKRRKRRRKRRKKIKRKRGKTSVFLSTTLTQLDMVKASKSSHVLRSLHCLKSNENIDSFTTTYRFTNVQCNLQ